MTMKTFKKEKDGYFPYDKYTNKPSLMKLVERCRNGETGKGNEGTFWHQRMGEKKLGNTVK